MNQELQQTQDPRQWPQGQEGTPNRLSAQSRPSELRGPAPARETNPTIPRRVAKKATSSAIKYFLFAGGGTAVGLGFGLSDLFS